METFLEFIKEVFKGIVRAISACLFQKTFLNKEKITHAVVSRVVFVKSGNFL